MAGVKLRAVLEALQGGQVYPPPIAVDSGQGDLILVEGYTRATAYAVLGPPASVEFLMGTSLDIRQWISY